MTKPHTVHFARRQNQGMIRRRQTAQALAAAQRGQNALASAHLGRREPGTPLPVNLPSRARLLDLGIDALEDLEGASAQGLMAVSRLTSKQANAVLEAAMVARVARGTNNKTLLPEDFPARDILLLAGYNTIESLDGHNEKVLLEIKGMTAELAKAVVAQRLEIIKAQTPPPTPPA